MRRQIPRWTTRAEGQQRKTNVFSVGGGAKHVAVSKRSPPFCPVGARRAARVPHERLGAEALATTPLATQPRASARRRRAHSIPTVVPVPLALALARPPAPVDVVDRARSDRINAARALCPATSPRRITRRCRRRSSRTSRASRPRATLGSRESCRRGIHSRAALSRRASTRCRAAAEPDWKTKQREQDALISVEEDHGEDSRGGASRAHPGLGRRARAATPPRPRDGARPRTSPARSAAPPRRSRAASSSARRRFGCCSSRRFAASTCCCSARLFGTAKVRARQAPLRGVRRRRRVLRAPSDALLRAGGAVRPLSMRGLENDRYVRQTEGYLPDATVAFVDEVFKANSAISELAAHHPKRASVRQRQRARRGAALCLVGASNELPNGGARRAVRPLPVAILGGASQRGEPRRFARHESRRAARQSDRVEGAAADAASPVTNTMPLTVKDFEGVKSAAEAAVEVPQSVVDLIVDLRAPAG